MKLDRASAIAATIIGIVADHLSIPGDLPALIRARREIEDHLRDEFADIASTVWGERRGDFDD
jgi:hypothetical protein